MATGTAAPFGAILLEHAWGTGFPIKYMVGLAGVFLWLFLLHVLKKSSLNFWRFLVGSVGAFLLLLFFFGACPDPAPGADRGAFSQYPRKNRRYLQRPL